MRPDELYLRDMADACTAIERFLANVDEPRFRSDEVLQAAVLQKLTVIGEGAARISPSLKERHDEVEWRTIAGLRNVAVHEYFGHFVGHDLGHLPHRRARTAAASRRDLGGVAPRFCGVNRLS
jgi:uncharacterized protein with HEPN domain